MSTTKSTDLLKKMQELNLEMNALKKKYLETGKEHFTIAMKEFFELYPFVSKIQWCQYTPYFNDGDECIFSVHDPEILFDFEVLGQECPYEDEEYNYGEGSDFNVIADHYKEWYTENDWAATAVMNQAAVENALFDKGYDVVSFTNTWSELQSFICSEEDLMKDLFGDHAIIEVTNKGASSDDYDHD